jgi:hypothetical protein
MTTAITTCLLLSYGLLCSLMAFYVKPDKKERFFCFVEWKETSPNHRAFLRKTLNANFAPNPCSPCILKGWQKVARGFARSDGRHPWSPRKTHPHSEGVPET